MWWMFALTALSSALLTVLAIGIYVEKVARPRLERELEKKLSKRIKSGLDVLEERIEKAVRRGVLDGVQALTSKEVLQDTTRSLARSGAELVENSISQMLGRRRREDKNAE